MCICSHSIFKASPKCECNQRLRIDADQRPAGSCGCCCSSTVNGALRVWSWLRTGFRSAVATSRAHRHETRADSPSQFSCSPTCVRSALSERSEATLLHGGHALSSAGITVRFVAILQMLRREGLCIARRKAWLPELFNSCSLTVQASVEVELSEFVLRGRLQLPGVLAPEFPYCSWEGPIVNVYKYGGQTG